MKQDVYEDKTPQTASNHVGIEIECVTDRHWENVGDVVGDLAKWVTVTEDGSIDEDDGYGCELKICASEQSFRKVVAKACARLQEVNASVNKSCGLHVHLDMRNRDVAVCFNNLVIAQPLLYAMQPESRRNNSYCLTTRQGVTFEQAAASYGRYSGINSQAFRKHKTLEVRIHSGTTNPTKIVKWVELLLAIVRHPKVNSISEFKLPSQLQAYVTYRTNKFNQEVVNEAA